MEEPSKIMGILAKQSKVITMVLRAKTIGLLQTRPLNDKQKRNTHLNLQELEHTKKSLESYPRRIVLELTSACNLRCIMCGRSAADFKDTFFKLSHLEKIKDTLEHAEEVTLFGWGEPTVHPKFIEILKYLNNYPVRKYFVTNGMTLDKIKDALFEYKVDIVAISIDGANAETNNKIRRGSDFDKIIKSIKSIVEEKKKRNLKYPYMNFVFTAMDMNFREIPDMVELTKNTGIEELKVVYFTAFSDKLIDQSLWNRQKEVKEIFSKAINKAQELDIKIKLPHIQGEDIAKDKFHKDCFVAWRDFFLGSDGYVRSCLSTSKKLFHIDDYESFFEMWNSEVMKKFRECVNNIDCMPAECKKCYQASYANWNRKESFLQVGTNFAPEWHEDTETDGMTKK